MVWAWAWGVRFALNALGKSGDFFDLLANSTANPLTYKAGKLRQFFNYVLTNQNIKFISNAVIANGPGPVVDYEYFDTLEVLHSDI